MLRLLGQRAPLRAYATNASRFAPVAFSPLATRSPVHTRSFLTTASVSVAEASATETDSTPRPRGRPRDPTKTKTSGTAKKPAAKKAAKKPAKKPSKPKPKAPVSLEAMKISKEDKLPKRPRNAWNFFYIEYYKEHGPASTVAEVLGLSKAGSQVWKSLSDADKKKYHDAAEQSRADYDKTMSEYLQRVDPQVLKAIDAKRKAKGQNKFAKPPALKHLVLKRPRSAFILFRDDIVSTLDVPSDVKGIARGRSLAVEASKKWKELSEEEKAPYLEAHRKGLQEWLAKTTKPAT